MDVISKFLKKNRKKSLNIHCLGDAVVDEYCQIDVSRVSPEAPALVMRSFQEKFSIRPGSVANVAYQFKHFNVDVALHTFYDRYATFVFDACGTHRWLGTSYAEAHLPIKRRYIDDNGVQVVRHDIEQPLCGLTVNQIDDYYRGLSKELNQQSVECDVAIFSDYDKGFFSGTKKYLNLFKGVKTIVDPKLGPLDKWKGCTIFKPNAKEAFDLSGLSDWQEQVLFFQQKLGCSAVVITHGGEKVVGIDHNEFFCYMPTKTVHVESVVGAGDCFCAFFAMAIGHGFTVPEAVEIAWNAGARYVQGTMNQPITPAELSLDGIVEPEDLRDRDFKLVFANGCFDLIHIGHLSTLEFAKGKGDKLVVALNSDASVERLKGKGRPVMPLEQRMAVMSSLKSVDFVVSFDEDTPLEVIKKIRPDVLVKGEDYKKEDIVGADIVPEVFQVPLIEGLSSSKFIRKIH